MNKYKNLEIWNRSVALATEVYSATTGLPKEETYGITSQIRRSVVSVSSNIAEGAGRSSKKEFKRFLDIAYGSICELETQLLIAKNLGYINGEIYESLEKEIEEIQKMIYSFSKSL